MIGQTSQAFLGSATALTVIYRAIQNGFSGLADDGLTQLNPCAIATAGTVSRYVNPIKRGCLSGSIAFTRPDGGNDTLGGPGDPEIQDKIKNNPDWANSVRPMGVFLNTATGNNAYDNQSTPGSGILMYVNGGGTYKNALYETQLIADLDTANAPVKTDILYVPGAELVGSRNGFLMPRLFTGKGGVRLNIDLVTTLSAEAYMRTQTTMDTVANLLTIMQRGGPTTTIAVLKMVPDASHPGIVYDQRI